MAGTSVLKLKVDDKEYNSSLKQAQQGLQHLGQALNNAGKSFTQVDKTVVDYVRSIGQMEAQSKTARGRIGEMSNAFVEFSLQYKQMSEEVKKSDVGKALAESIEQLKNRTIDAKEELDELNKSLNNVKMPEVNAGGGLFAGLGDKMSGALQVFAGNMLTKAAGAVANLGSEIFNSVQQGVELARQGEGIRIAFERLGRGDILDGLREATHGTVTDLELMKAAVKFNDFKLPVEELGTMLAFAQQKAKDTGQSVDYMVDSIVTGLGRKSLMILDNLGLSATEVKDKMAETGDMTKAVGAIIREQMSKAGDYVETAADRAAQANVSLQNKMEELGRKFAPVEEASSQLWTSMKIGILDVIGGPLTDLLNKLTEAGRLMNAYGKMGGNAKVGRMTSNLASASEGNRQSIYQQQQAQFWKYINPREKQLKDIRAWQSGDRNEALQKRIGAITEKYGSLDATKIQAEVDAAKKMLADYRQAAKQILSPVKADIDTKGAEQNVESLKVKLIELESQRKKAIAAGDTDLSKNLAKQISQVKSDIKGLGGTTTTTTKTHKATPQETAANKIKEAERTYAETLLKNSIRLEEGMDTTLEYKKRELSAQERLFDAYNDAYATYQDPAYKKASTEAAEKIRTLAGEVKAASDAQEAARKSARELDAAQRKLADAQQKLAEARATGSATAVYKAQKNVDKQQDVVSRLQNPTLPAKPQQPTGFDALKQTVQAEIKFDQMKVDETALHTLLQTALQNGLDNLTPDYAGLQERIAKGIDIPDSTWEELYDEINEKLKDLGIKPIEIPIETVGKDVKAITKAAKTTADVVGSIGDAFNAIEDPAAKVMGTVMQAIASVALGYAQATVQASSMGPWAWVAFAASGLATMLSTISAIHSSTGYAEGGMIKGNSYSGDNIGGLVDGSQLVGLNAGEIVLTAANQNMLAQNLQGGGGTVNVVGRVVGEDIFLSADRYARRSGRGSILTGKNL